MFLLVRHFKFETDVKVVILLLISMDAIKYLEKVDVIKIKLKDYIVRRPR